MSDSAAYTVTIAHSCWSASSHDIIIDRVNRSVRLPTNVERNSNKNRGVILGEGKPENQNHAIIFCFSEALQAIDMNQVHELGMLAH